MVSGFKLFTIRVAFYGSSFNDGSIFLVGLELHSGVDPNPIAIKKFVDLVGRLVSQTMVFRVP